jgi:SNF2-related domain
VGYVWVLTSPLHLPTSPNTLTHTYTHTQIHVQLCVCQQLLLCTYSHPLLPNVCSMLPCMCLPLHLSLMSAQDEVERAAAHMIAAAAAAKAASSSKAGSSGKAASSSAMGDVSALHAVRWRRIVLDEAHCIKDRACNTAKAVFALTGRYKWALSGTPLQVRALIVIIHC